MKKALITGITGQDGSYLAELLLEKNYEVHGVVRRSSSFNRSRIEHLRHDLLTQGTIALHYGDMTDSSSLGNIIAEVRPDEVYNLAAQSHVAVSFELPEYTSETDALGTLRLLDAIHANGLTHHTRFYQASTSELYGQVLEIPQKETTPFYPRSPYGVSKLFAYWITVNYREAYGMYACNGILFNHESPRRGENFVTRKITLSLAHILKGDLDKLSLGNLNAKRDWGFAGDYVEGMWRMLQHNQPEDFVLATNEQHTVREFVELAFGYCGFEIVWRGTAANEKGIDKATGRVLVEIDPKYLRLSEVDSLVGNFSKARDKLGWKPQTQFKQLVRMMVESDLKLCGLSPNQYVTPSFPKNV